MHKLHADVQLAKLMFIQIATKRIEILYVFVDGNMKFVNFAYDTYCKLKLFIQI